MKRQVGFFDVDERLQRLSDLGDQLEAYAGTVDFETVSYTHLTLPTILLV